MSSPQTPIPFEIPDYIRSLSPYVPGKPIEETQREYKIKRVIKLASNENPLGPSPKALRALNKRDAQLHRYPDAAAYRLKMALCRSLGVESTQLIVGNGSNEVIDQLVRVFCVPGDAMVTSEGAFIAYQICAQVHGVRTVKAPLRADLRFDLKTMARLVREDARVKLVFLPNPNNPTGTYVGEAELRSFLKEVQEIRGGSVLVALDYAYWEYVTARDLPDPHVLAADFSNVVVLRTFSKIYGLAGLRIGYGVGEAGVISALEKVRQPFNVSSAALVAAEVALSDRAFVTRAKKLNTQGLEVWYSGLKKLGIPYWQSQGNFVLADVRQGLGKFGGDVYLDCLKKGVIFRPVANYGMPNYLRISVGTPAENKQALKVLGEIAKMRSSR